MSHRASDVSMHHHVEMSLVPEDMIKMDVLCSLHWSLHPALTQRVLNQKTYCIPGGTVAWSTIFKDIRIQKWEFPSYPHAVHLLGSCKNQMDYGR